MILFVLVGICLATVPLTGGNLRHLANLPLRGVWLAPVALAVQVVIVTIAPGGSEHLHAVVHIGTYALIAAFLLVNLRIPGAMAIAVGALANVLAILGNGGVMPASATAQRLAGLIVGGGFHNSASLAHPHLLWLGDIIPVPGPLPNVLSIGDCIIFAGTLALLHLNCQPALLERWPRGIVLTPVLEGEQPVEGQPAAGFSHTVAPARRVIPARS